MRRVLLILASLGILCGLAFSQAGTTVVTGQVKDTSGNLYVNCQWSVVFVGQNTTPGVGPYAPASLLNGQQGNCDSSGNLPSINLADNINTVTPTPSQWNFSICSASGYVGGPFCKANILITITGATQNITATLTPLMPLLPVSGGGGTPGTPSGTLQGNNGGAFGGIPNTTVNFTTGAITTTAPFSINGGGNLSGTFTGNWTTTGTVTGSVLGNIALKQFAADNTIYVSTSGNDSNDGLSPGTAKLTLAGALAALPAPGVVGWIKFGAGTFTFNNVTLPAAASNLESLRISGMNTNRSAPNGGLAGGTIFSNTSTTNPTLILGPGTAGVTIEGIYFTTTTLNSTTPHIYDNSGTSASGVNSQNYFVNDYFQGGGYGIQINAPSVTGGSNFETYILSSQFNQQTTDCIHVTSALQGQASQLTIQGSRCQLFGANGIFMTNASGVLIDNNQITSNAGSIGDNLFINAGGGSATTISNNELESLPTSNASTHAMNLNGGSFSIFNNAIFNTTGAISCTCNNSTIGTNNFGAGSSGAGWDVMLNAGSTQNVVMSQSGQYPFGYFKDNSGVNTNQMFNIDGTGLNQFANIKVNGCTAGQFVKGDGTGCSSGTTAPGSPSGSIQGNSSGSFAAIPNASYNTSTGAITTTATVSTGALTATNLTSSGGTLTLTGCAAGTFAKADGTGCTTGTGAGNTVFTSLNSNNLATAIAAAGTGGYVYVDAPITLANSSQNVNTANLTIACQSGLVPIKFQAASRLQFANGANAKNVTVQNCNFQGPDMAAVGGAPITVGNNGNADGFKWIGNSANGWGSTSSNGVLQIGAASHVEVAGYRVGDQAIGNSCTVSTASWTGPTSGNLLGTETITFTAAGACASAFPADFAVHNGLLCSNMVPLGYNAPGDGSSIYFGQIITTTYPSLTVQQIYNPGSYTSGGTCSAGVGNGDADLVFLLPASITGIFGDWDIHDNDIGTMTFHNSSPNSQVSNVRINNNSLHAGLSNGYYWCSELGVFQGATTATADSFHGVSESNNTCTLVADVANGSNIAGGFSQGNSQEVTETGNKFFAAGHTFSAVGDENAGVQHLTSTGNLFNGLGGGILEDLNGVNNATVSGSTFLFGPPGTTNGYLTMGQNPGGIGLQAPGGASNNTIIGNTFIGRVNLCGDMTHLSTGGNGCAAQILNAVGSAGTVTFTFQPGVVNPGLAAAQTIAVAGNSTAGGCSGSDLNGTLTIATVIGGGTGFTVTDATINGQTCTGGKATSTGLNNPSGTTYVATFPICPHPFRIGDPFYVTGDSNVPAAYKGSFTVSALTEQNPCTVSYTGGSGSQAQSGSTGTAAYASNYGFKMIFGQLTIANGGHMDNNVFANNNFLCGGTAANAAASAISMAVTSATSGTADRNQITGNAIDGCVSLFNMSSSGGGSVTNTKIELGKVTNFTNIFTTWTTGSTISCDSANPSCQVGACTGTVNANPTNTFLYNLGSNTGLACSGNTTENFFVTAKGTGIVRGLNCSGSGTYVSAVVTARKNSATVGGITCTLTGATPTCSDLTHQGSFVQGDQISVLVAGGAAETGTAPKCSLDLWYQDN